MSSATHWFSMLQNLLGTCFAEKSARRILRTCKVQAMNLKLSPVVIEARTSSILLENVVDCDDDDQIDVCNWVPRNKQPSYGDVNLSSCKKSWWEAVLRWWKVHLVEYLSAESDQVRPTLHWTPFQNGSFIVDLFQQRHRRILVSYSLPLHLTTDRCFVWQWNWACQSLHKFGCLMHARRDLQLPMVDGCCVLAKRVVDIWYHLIV